MESCQEACCEWHQHVRLHLHACHSPGIKLDACSDLCHVPGSFANVRLMIKCITFKRVGAPDAHSYACLGSLVRFTAQVMVIITRSARAVDIQRYPVSSVFPRFRVVISAHFLSSLFLLVLSLSPIIFQSLAPPTHVLLPHSSCISLSSSLYYTNQWTSNLHFSS